MKFFSFSLCALMIFSSLEAKATVIESDHASYNGKQMFLQGNVRLQHPFGTIEAKEANLLRTADSKDFSVADVKDGVRFLLQDGGILTCDRLHLDVPSGQGELINDYGPVSYKGLMADQELFFTASRIDLSFAPELAILQHIVGRAPVQATYAGQFVLDAHSANFDQSTAVITFLPRENEKCQMTYCKEHKVLGTKIEVHPKKHAIMLFDPNGSLFSSKEQQILFYGQDLTWDQEQDRLILSHDAKVEGSNWTLKSDKQVILQLTSSELRNLESIGNTSIVLDDQTTLICPGVLSIDQDKQIIHLQGSHNQVNFTDALGQVLADQIIINYILQDEKPQPTKLFFFGHVAVMNNAPLHKGDKEIIERYALADKVTYIPQSKTLHLLADSGKRVLFFDKVKKMQLSAEEIIADLPKGDHKERITTKGRVRMILDEQEFKELKNHFALEESCSTS